MSYVTNIALYAFKNHKFKYNFLIKSTYIEILIKKLGFKL